MGNSVISIQDKKSKCSLQGEGFCFVLERKEREQRRRANKDNMWRWGHLQKSASGSPPELHWRRTFKE